MSADAVLDACHLAGVPDVEHAWRASGTTRVNAHARITIRYPLLGIDKFPVLILVGRAGEHFGGGFDQTCPIAFIAVLKRQSFCIRTITENHGYRPSRAGRNTSARRTMPSSISIGMSQSMCMPSRISVFVSFIRSARLKITARPPDLRDRMHQALGELFLQYRPVRQHVSRGSRVKRSFCAQPCVLDDL